MKLTKDQLKEAVLTVYGLLCSGEDESDILDEMGLTATQYEELKKKMFDVKTDEVRSKPIEHVYVEYIIEQLRNISALNDIIANYRQTKQATALVGAIRARSEITDKLITRGQEFGLIKKVANRNELVAGVVIANLSNQELKKEITGALGGLNKLISQYGESSIIDVTPGKIHHGRGLPEAVLYPATDVEKESEKKSSKRRDKVRKGRRVVKRRKEIE
jgi:hypothetical protein